MRKLAERAQLVHHVQRRHLVGLGESRVVEDGVDEVFDGSAATHHGLADVHQLGGVRAEDVNAEQLQILGRDEQFEHAVRVARDLAAGQLAYRDTPTSYGMESRVRSTSVAPT